MKVYRFKRGFIYYRDFCFIEGRAYAENEIPREFLIDPDHEYSFFEEVKKETWKNPSDS